MERLQEKILHKGKSAGYGVAMLSGAAFTGSSALRLVSEGILHASNETLQTVNSVIFISLMSGFGSLLIIGLIDKRIEQLKGAQNVQHTH